MLNIESEEKLIKEISQYDRFDLISKSVSLLLFPEFLPNTIRIEKLINLAVKYADGKEKVNRGILNQILNKKLEERILEDPSEELFSGNIVSPNGNFLMLEGIWRDNIFSLQQLINAICILDECKDIYNVVLDILKISNNILSDAGIKAYIESNGTNGVDIDLPPLDTINKFSEYVIFNDLKLSRLSIKKDNLEYFIIKDKSLIDINSQNETILHRKPIIKVDNNYIIIPSFLGFAIKKFILDKSKNYLDKIEQILHAQQSNLIFSKIKEEKLDIERKVPDILNDKIIDEVYKIDIDK